MHPVGTLPFIHESVSLVELQRAFPNPIDLRAALHKTPNGDLYRKICVRELTVNKEIREAYYFAREIAAFQERDAEFKSLIPECVALDAKDILDDLFASASPYWNQIFRFTASGLYLIESRNIPRFIEVLLTVTEVTLNESLVGLGFAHIAPPHNGHVVGSIIETYLYTGQAAYSIHLIKNICPLLNPNAPVEDLLFEAGLYLHANGKYEQIQLIFNELTTRRSELLERILTALLEQGEIAKAITVAQGFPNDLEALLFWMGQTLIEKGMHSHLPPILNNMDARKAELFERVSAALSQQGRLDILESIISALTSKGP